ncbi:uncharacterized protein LOC124541832 [Vanessa cardui]|uniref:uncharacterized protein LOC124541829 n=1 Tax=Vanessa cardui TaxID=171605 RepID=UPI001F1451BA|nr:uncharacterized protein LOC124541829 [Vanessa cardui]XP_046975695.1 uncharacterized protein LOC124541830 [Vanessa cardui]XP_046975696.1 uncharacterized protein LOC124541831 [Vanessa cardui]XP_046975697.1 uncharacterized protein LOC124541832 [Vanessa cardui]
MEHIPPRCSKAATRGEWRTHVSRRTADAPLDTAEDSAYRRARRRCRRRRLRPLWARVLRALAPAARRDDGGLAALAHHYRRYIQSTSGWSAVIESCSFLSEALDPARTPHVLTTSLTLSCVCALMERAIVLVNTPEATANERQWYKFLKSLARALKNTTLIVAKPIQPLPEAKVLHHIKQLESRSTIEILQRGKAADFELTKTDVCGQLVQHLC